MVDSVQVFDAGFRVLDSNGDPVSGAKIKFRYAGPGAVLPVYGDKDLSTSLGSTVYTRSDGYPVVAFGSNTTTLIYTGSSAYYIEITDENDVAIFPAKDNVRGALDTSTFLTSGSNSTLSISVAALLADTTLTSAYNGKLINADPSSGTFALTLDSAVTLGNGWNCEIKHKGSSNYVKITASENIEGPWGTKNSFALLPGEAVSIRCDGGTFKVSGYVPPFIKATTGLLIIVDRVSSAPSSPNPGDRYIATGIFTAGGVTTAIGDIIEATGQGTYIKTTPASNSGWLAWIQSTSTLYQYQSTAWVPLAATQAQMEAASGNSVYATPGNMLWHPGIAKAWGVVTVSGGTPTLAAGYNIASITDNGVGNFSPVFTAALSSTNYSVVAIVDKASPTSSRSLTAAVALKLTTAFQVFVMEEGSTAGANTSATDIGFSFVVYGDFA